MAQTNRGTAQGVTAYRCAPASPDLPIWQRLGAGRGYAPYSSDKRPRQVEKKWDGAGPGSCVKVAARRYPWVHLAPCAKAVDPPSPPPHNIAGTAVCHFLAISPRNSAWSEPLRGANSAVRAVGPATPNHPTAKEQGSAREPVLPRTVERFSPERPAKQREPGTPSRPR